MKTYTLDDILSDTTQQPEPLIGEGILLKQSFLLITGAKKVRKTFLAYNLGIALASGKGFAGFKIDSICKVLILSAEGGYYPNRERIKTMCNTIKPADLKNLVVCFDPRLKLENFSDFAFLSEQLSEIAPEVLIIDPFVKFHNLEENSATDMGIILDRLRTLIEDFNLSIILVHHLGKDHTHGARGSSAIMGEYDSCITLSKEGSDNKLQNKIEFDLRHSLSPDSRKLIFNEITFWFEEEVSPIVKLLKTFGSMEKKTLVERCLANGVYSHHSGAYKAIDKELLKGKIGLSEVGKYYLY